MEKSLGALELIRKIEWLNLALLSEVIIVSFMEMFVVMDAEVGQLAIIQVATVGTWRTLERLRLFLTCLQMSLDIRLKAFTFRNIDWNLLVLQFPDW